MAARLEKIENSAAHLEIEISAEVFEEAMEKAYRKVRTQIMVPGFRRGRVPRQILEAQFGREVLYEDALEIAVPDAYEAALEELQIEGLAPPDFDIPEEIQADKPVIIKAVVAVKPEVTHGELKGLEIMVPIMEIGDEDVDKQLQAMRERYSEIIASEEPAKMGDTVHIDFEGFIDEVAFEGGKGTDYPLELGSNSFIPGFEEQLVGIAAGSDTEVKVPFPEEYHAEELAGKDAVFKVRVNRVETKQLRELDDDFAQEVSNFDTLAELREDLRAKSIEVMEQEQNRFRRDMVVGKALEVTEMELPEALIDVRVENMVRQLEQQLMRQGMGINDYISYSGMQMDTLKSAMRPDAINNLRTSFMLEKIADEQEIVISDEELEAELKNMADSMGMDAAEAPELMAGIRDSLMMDMRINRAVDYLVENAVITEISKDELEARLIAEEARAEAEEAEEAEAPVQE